jgi:hypothetical protein
MFSGMFSPITEAMQALSSAVIIGLFIFGAIQVSQIVVIATRAYYGLKIIKQVSILLKEIINEVGEIKKNLKE